MLKEEAGLQLQPVLKNTASRALPTEMIPEKSNEKLYYGFLVLLSCAPSGVLKL